MAWKDLIKSQVNNAFNILDDLVDTISWVKRSDPQFSDGSYTYTETTKSISAVPTKYESRLVDGERIKNIDRELVIRVADVTGLTDDDQFIFESKTWVIIDKFKDPSSTIWQVQVRPE